MKKAKAYCIFHGSLSKETWDKFYLTDEELKKALADKRVNRVQLFKEEDRPITHEKAIAASYFYKSR